MPQKPRIRKGRVRSPLLVSVIIPVYNAAHHLSRCLAALDCSTYKSRECIVVDDGSTDGSREVACRSGAQVLSLTKNQGPARARNRGAAAARGEVLLFIDADVCVHPETLGRIAAVFARHSDVAAVMGSYDDEPDDLSFISQYKNLFHHYVHQHANTEASTFWSGCGAVRRSVFLAMGGFDEGYARACIEDIELGFRLCRAGHRIRLEKAIQVRHLKRWTFTSLVRTDLLYRGVPWVALMLRDRRAVSDLNLGWGARMSTLLSYTLLLSLAELIRAGCTGASGPAVLIWPPLVLLLAILVIHQDFYRFFIRKRGHRFAAAAIPLHLLYFLYSGLALPLGMWAYLASAPQSRRRGRRLAASLSRSPGSLTSGVAPWEGPMPSLAVVGAGPEGSFGRESQSL